jgi:hypothetical protein
MPSRWRKGQFHKSVALALVFRVVCGIAWFVLLPLVKTGRVTVVGNWTLETSRTQDVLKQELLGFLSIRCVLLVVVSVIRISE